MESSGNDNLEELRSYIDKLEANAIVTEREVIAFDCIKYCLSKGVGISGNYRGSLSLNKGKRSIVDSLNIVFDALESPDKSAIFELHERIYQHITFSPRPVFIPNYEEQNENEVDDEPF